MFVSAEVFPLAKAGGLADVSAALPAALVELGVDMRVLMPGYRGALAALAEAGIETKPSRARFDFPGFGSAGILEARLPGSGVPLWLVDCPPLYDRPGGPYQDEAGRGWPDELERFVMLSRCADAVATAPSFWAERNWKPDVVHCNDWHTGLVCPLLLSAEQQLRDLYGERRPRSVFTIHNLAFDGTFSRGNPATVLGLSSAALSQNGIATPRGFSLLKAGIAYADWVTTVSPTYAREIRTPRYGGPFAGLLDQQVAKLSGILNGVDYRVWDPATDPHIAARFSATDLSGKSACNGALLEAFGVSGDARGPVFGCVSRLAGQKGIDLIPEALSRALDSGCRFVLLGRGDVRIEGAIRGLALRFPGRVGARFEFSEPLAHAVEAGADIFLMPSRFEPCGLNQMYSMRYGTPPVVREVGGLADSVVDATEASMRAGTATGFTFALPDTDELADAIARSLAVFARADQWRALQRTGMREDFSWQRSANRYLDLYESL